MLSRAEPLSPRLWSLARSQSFGRVGTPGAVVWLGYSWKDGPKAAWGALLEKLVVDFRNGGYRECPWCAPVGSA